MKLEIWIEKREFSEDYVAFFPSGNGRYFTRDKNIHSLCDYLLGMFPDHQIIFDRASEKDFKDV